MSQPIGATRATRPQVPQETVDNQRMAADPTVSAWVSANAGTGKTHVLSRRVLRLLLSGRDGTGVLVGTPPERILCLTFTKAAAAEMAQRIFKDLGAWVIAPEAELVARLTDLLGRPAVADELRLARRLFARAIETPGGLKVQTIHSFCEKLLQRFPLEAGIAPNFTVLDEATARELMSAALDGTLRAAVTMSAGDPDSQSLAAALELTIGHAVEETFEQVVRGVLELAGRHDIDLPALSAPEAMAALERDLRAAFGVRADIARHQIEAELGEAFCTQMAGRLAQALREGSAQDHRNLAHIDNAATAGSTRGRVTAARSYFLVRDDETKRSKPRKSLMTKGLQAAHEALHDDLKSVQETFARLNDEAQGLAVVAASLAITRLAADVAVRYQAQKVQRAALDYGDLIGKAAGLLARSDATQWVLYKLDGGLDHILVDEAQDTSRLQWAIVESLAEEFHAGDSAREDRGHSGPRTVFAVGDEKQSIYGFQGAAPKLFAAMGHRFAARAKAAGATLRTLPLNLSFRTVAPVLEVVDRVFGGPDRPKGVTVNHTTPVRHLVYRAGEPGLVEVWDPEAHAVTERADPWSTEEDVAALPPPVRLAARIAQTIRQWLDDKVILASAGRPIVESDILILVRKRTPFASPMIRALKSAGIAVAGADRIAIAEELAVMDLLALCDVLLLPEDDLALATVLKSPICGFTEDELMILAVDRPGSLWQALLKAERAGRHTRIVGELKRWRAWTDYRPPYELLASILDHGRAGGSVRARLLARLGLEAAEALDELMNLALAYDEKEAPSLQGFLAWMRRGGAEIKRDMEQGRPEVRIMTIHGAKGLEAPIVFLADTCTTASGGIGPKLLALNASGERPSYARSADADVAGTQTSRPQIVWPLKDTSGLGAIRAAKASVAEDDAHEYHRLLYVAMTRARDRLYICGFEGSRGRQPGCWYDLIERGLETGQLETGQLETTVDSHGRRIRRKTVLADGAPTTVALLEPDVMREVPLPAWATTRAAPVSARSVPLRPSRLAPVSMEDSEGDAPTQAAVVPGHPASAARSGAGRAAGPQPSAQVGLRPAVLAAGNRFLRGELTHALLQRLPEVEPARRRAVAEGFLAHRAPEFAAGLRHQIVVETLAILEAPAFAPLFGPHARAEVAIAAEIPPPEDAPAGRAGAPLRITGQIDRLVDLGTQILVVDYKSNRLPPQEVGNVAEAYLLQLAAYRMALGMLWPGRVVRCALLWTDGPRMMEIPQAILEAHEQKLWLLDAGADKRRAQTISAQSAA